MRCAIVLLALVAFGATLPQQQQKQHAADQEFLKRQQDCILLLQQITEEIPNEQLHILGTTYNIQNNYHQYENPILVKYYVGAVHYGLVQPKGTTYSNSISQLRKEVALLHRVLLGAKDYQTFLATAAWARINVNEEQFIKAFIGAVLQHPETQGIILPPLYEIVPHYYFDARIIHEVQNIAAQDVRHYPIVIPVNYTAHLFHDEHQLSYFTQDVGLANYYGFVNLAGYLLEKESVQYQHQGIHNQENHIGHGSLYYYLHQQLLAHYELNRLANELGPVHNTDYVNVQAPYQPHLRYINGLEFPGRPENLQLKPFKNHLVLTVKKFEQRLIEAIDSGHVITPQGAFLSLYQPQGLDILGELIQGTGRSVNPRYYGSLQAVARQLLGNAPEVYSIYDYTPSVLELGQIAVCDPAFYQLYKKIIQLFAQYQNSLPGYQYNDVLLPGVSIQKVEISPLVTLFNEYFVDLDGVTTHHQVSQQMQQQEQVHQHQQVQQGYIKAQLKRLDHKPYEYQITVHSEKNVPDAIVRVYLGPKYDYYGKPISISQHRHQFVELDQFMAELQQGQNVIVRHSHQAPGQSFDYPSVQQIKHSVNSAVHAQEPFYTTEPYQIFGFPARLSLPKGQQGQGFPVQLFVVISQQGQLNVPYGPVIPERFQTYQRSEYEVVSSDEYLQQIQHQDSKIVGVKQTVEVVPENIPINQQEYQNAAVRTHFPNMYTQQHEQYPYMHTQYGVGQEQIEKHVLEHPVYTHNQYHGQQPGQQGQYTQMTQQRPQHMNVYHGYLPHDQQYHHYHSLLNNVGTSGVHGKTPITSVSGQDTQQGMQDVQGVQEPLPGTQTVPEIQGEYHSTYQGQSQKQQGFGVEYSGSGQYHAGGYQGILGQGQKTQDGYISKYYQNKHISQIIGGAISLDDKPLGYPLDRPLTTGALSVPNIHVQTVYIFHEEFMN